jgi:hypothetical protein
MKNIIKLGLLAALAGGSVSATTVSFTGSTTSVSSITSSPAGVSISGYYWNGAGNVWSTTNVSQNSLGVGVHGINSPNGTLIVEGSWQEYVLLDFGGTSTGVVTIDSLVLNFPNNATQAPTSPYFKYAWVTTPPSGINPDITTLPTYASPSSASNTSANLWTFGGVTGTGRYLLLGGINTNVTTSHYFQVNAVSYTSVPDGASTLALMGAAVATLGLAARRRKQ